MNYLIRNIIETWNNKFYSLLLYNECLVFYTFNKKDWQSDFAYIHFAIMNIDDHNKYVNIIKSEINLRRKIDREVITILTNSNEIVTGKINSFEK